MVATSLVKYRPHLSFSAGSDGLDFSVEVYSGGSGVGGSGGWIGLGECGGRFGDVRDDDVALYVHDVDDEVA